MPVREIPKAYEYECDGCGKKHLQENANGHYTDSRPPRWSRLILKRTAYDHQGSACADATVDRLFCDECTSKVARAINNVLVITISEAPSVPRKP